MFFKLLKYYFYKKYWWSFIVGEPVELNFAGCCL